jgi:hypothetical protein
VILFYVSAAILIAHKKEEAIYNRSRGWQCDFLLYKASRDLIYEAILYGRMADHSPWKMVVDLC